LSLVFNSTPLLRTGIQMGIWWFLAPVFVVMSHRMVPFFSATLVKTLDAWRPNWVLALALNAISHGLMAASGDAVSLGLAPLHAMTMGYLGCTMFAMVTRISSGHGGRKESADNTAWSLYWVLQAAVVLRVSAAISGAYSPALTLAAVAAWCVVMVGWAVRYGGWLGTPRPDGRDG
jgi:uncharacterized protein involved in response to NO